MRAMNAVSTTLPTGARGAIDRDFSITGRGSTFSRELRGGIVTFFAMSYILVLNPLIIGLVPDGAGQYLGGGDAPNLPAIAAGTALIAGLMSVLMGVVAQIWVSVAIVRSEARLEEDPRRMERAAARMQAAHVDAVERAGPAHRAIVRERLGPVVPQDD